MRPRTLFRPLSAAALAAGLSLSAAPAPAQITGSLPAGHPMKDGSTGRFGATFNNGGAFGGGTFGRSNFGGANFGGLGVGRGFVGGGFVGGVGGFGFPGVGYGGFGFPGYGYGFNPYLTNFSLTPYGAAVNQYGPFVGVSPGVGGATFGPPGTGAATLGPGLGFGGYGPGYGGYGYGGYGAGGYPTVPVGIDPSAAGTRLPAAVNANPVLGAEFREQAERWRAPLNMGDAGPLPPEARPADERELADAIREERSGDEAFSQANFRKALAHYRRAVDAAPTRGESLYRSALARIALGQWAAAGDDLRRALTLNPSLPTTGPTLRELLGGRHAIARASVLGGVAELARGDVRDADRLFLLGATMHADGDDRAREIFEAAWRLTGGRPYLRPYLDPVAVEFGAPAAADPASDDLADAAPMPEAAPPARDDRELSLPDLDPPADLGGENGIIDADGTDRPIR